MIPLLLVVWLLFNQPLQSQSTPAKLPFTSFVQPVASLAQAEVDSLKALLSATPERADKIELYGQLCFTYASTIGNIALAHSYADSLKGIATQLKHKAGLASADYYDGLLARYDGNQVEALRFLNRHMSYCKATGDASGLANSLFQLAVVHHELGNYEKSLSMSYRVLQLYERNHVPYGIAITYMHIGNLLLAMNKREDALMMYYKSLSGFTDMKQDLNAKMGRQKVLINLGNAYAENKQYEKAKMFYKQSLLLSNSIGSKRTAATALCNIGGVLNLAGQYDSALIYHLRALSIRELLSQKVQIAANLLFVGETYTFLKNYPLATHYLLKAASLSKEFHARLLLAETYQKLSKLYSAKRDFQKAYEYHQLFAGMKDSLLNEKTNRQLSEMQTKYKTGEKDKQIAILAKEKQVQQKEAQRQALQQKTLVGGLLLVTVIALLMIYLLRQRMKIQRIVMAKNQEIKESNLKRQMSELKMKALRAQINPHFIFNGMNSINRMILEQDTDSASRYLTKLSKLIRLILENSDKSSVSLENELTLLEAYLQLEKLRFKGQISYDIQVNEAIDQENTFLPSMVLQPFVENAIWHGLMHKEKNELGKIRISIEEADDVLTCVIEDNGVGREMATALKKKSVLPSQSMGLQITEERLKLFDRGKPGPLIYITDLKDAQNRALGTRVNLNVPLV